MERKIFGVDFNIFLLGIVSFLTDVSSEMIFSVFSVFFTVILGASAALLGLIEGLADFSASSLDYISGYYSDKLGKRKPFAIAGYGFSTIAKTMLVISSNVASASAFRVVERLGKSFRGPPRDAWISSLSDEKSKGYSFGLHKTMDKAGAILGPFIAYLILSYLGQNAEAFAFLFLVALVPAAMAVALLFFVKEKPEKPKERENIFKAYGKTGNSFRHFLKAGCIFSLAYFSFGFLLLKAYLVGFGIKDVVLLYALFNLAFVLVATPIGKLGDKVGRRNIMAAEYALYFLMSIGFAIASTKTEVAALFVAFGIFYAMDESQAKAYITDVEKERKATAIGIYNFFTGIIYLPASLIAGLLWTIKPAYAFAFAAVLSLAALVFFIFGKE